MGAVSFFGPGGSRTSQLWPEVGFHLWAAARKRAKRAASWEVNGTGWPLLLCNLEPSIFVTKGHPPRRMEVQKTVLRKGSASVVWNSVRFVFGLSLPAIHFCCSHVSGPSNGTGVSMSEISQTDIAVSKQLESVGISPNRK